MGYKKMVIDEKIKAATAKKSQQKIEAATPDKTPFAGFAAEQPTAAEPEETVDQSTPAAPDVAPVPASVVEGTIEAEKSIKALKTQMTSLKAETPLLRHNMEKAEQSYEVAKEERKTVERRVKYAESAVEKLMTDNGRLADQDRLAAEAILGKLRVAGALITGDLPTLTPDQKEQLWMKQMQEAMFKAVRNPNKPNMQEAEQTYRTAAKVMQQMGQGEVQALAAKAEGAESVDDTGTPPTVESSPVTVPVEVSPIP